MSCINQLKGIVCPDAHSFQNNLEHSFLCPCEKQVNASFFSQRRKGREVLSSFYTLWTLRLCEKIKFHRCLNDIGRVLGINRRNS
jgi:hypothetical protein